jgi:DNA-damage-inducible protein J
MANGAYIQARIDPQVKADAQNVLKSLGLSMSDAIGIYMRQIVLLRRIPFELKLPNQATLEAVEQLESGKGVGFDTADDLLKDLDN